MGVLVQNIRSDANGLSPASNGACESQIANRFAKFRFATCESHRAGGDGPSSCGGIALFWRDGARTPRRAGHIRIG